MSNLTPESITIDCTTGTIDENAPAEVAATYARADVVGAMAAKLDAWMHTATVQGEDIARLRAELAERNADVARLREELDRAGMASMSAPAMLRAQIQAEQPRTDAEWKDAERYRYLRSRSHEYSAGPHIRVWVAGEYEPAYDAEADAAVDDALRGKEGA